MWCNHYELQYMTCFRKEFHSLVNERYNVKISFVFENFEKLVEANVADPHVLQIYEQLSCPCLMGNRFTFILHKQ